LKYMIDQVNTKEKPARVALYPNVKKYWHGIYIKLQS
jgi:hypothetical protein